MTGDLEEAAIKDMLTRYQATGRLDVGVYEVGHHGSINGTTLEFVAAMSPEMAVIECGRPDHEATYCAWAFGHSRQEVVAMLEAGISTPRAPVRVKVGRGAKEFEDVTVTHAMFATGWDGIVVEAGADGVFRRVGADGATLAQRSGSAPPGRGGNPPRSPFPGCFPALDPVTTAVPNREERGGTTPSASARAPNGSKSPSW